MRDDDINKNRELKIALYKQLNLFHVFFIQADSFRKSYRNADFDIEKLDISREFCDSCDKYWKEYLKTLDDFESAVENWA